MEATRKSLLCELLGGGSCPRTLFGETMGIYYAERMRMLSSKPLGCTFDFCGEFELVEARPRRNALVSPPELGGESKLSELRSNLSEIMRVFSHRIM